MAKDWLNYDEKMLEKNDISYNFYEDCFFPREATFCFNSTARSFVCILVL